MSDIEHTRNKDLEKFLQQTGCADYEKQQLKGDASRRVYTRLKKSDGETLILADADPEIGEEPGAFGAVTKLLRDHKINAPEILHADYVRGFLIMEDFGDTLFSQVLTNNPERERELYEAALDILADIAKLPTEAVLTYEGGTHKLHDYDTARLLAEARLFLSWYVPELTRRNTPEFSADEFTTVLRGMLAPVVNTPHPVVVLRDYHADNLHVLNNGKKGGAGLGVIDYQDALIGNPAYDLVSLLQDARRDVSADLEAELIDSFLKRRTDLNREDFMRDYLILGAQRNIKILGIFARLYVRNKKSGYLQYLPRVWGYLERNLRSPLLKPLLAWFDARLPTELRKIIIGAEAA